jgi:hypothetical protein
MSETDLYQLYRCPEWIEEKLREVGGVNRFGEDNFIIRWAQGGQPECCFRAGGHWQHDGFVGYRDLLVGGGTPSWMLMVWEAPELYGTPEMYYMQNYDDETDLQDLGEYPYRGRYKLLYNLKWMEKRGNSMHIEAMPLNTYLLDTIVPIIMEAQDISWEKTKAVMQDIELREQAKDLDMIEDVMRSNALPFHGSPVSYSRQGCRTSLVDKKIEQMQRHMNKIMTNASILGKGLSSYEDDPTSK